MKKLNLSILLLLLTLISCKTQEQIRREQLVDNMNVQMTESQKLNADTTVRLQALEDRISLVTGQIDEKNYNTIKTTNERIQTLESKVSVIEENQKDIQLKLDSQKAYLDQVLSGLKKIAPKKKLSDYQQAMSDYKRGKYKSAKSQFLVLMEKKKLSRAQKTRIMHNLGMCYFIEKNFDSALIYFSRLFTEYPKSGYNKNGLYHLGRSFLKLGKKEEARQTFQQLIESFPKSKSAGKAKKELKGL